MSTDVPIDQWKVAELREELKRRNLPVKGLKDELIKRLDDDIHGGKEPVSEEAEPVADDRTRVVGQGVEVDGDLIDGKCLNGSVPVIAEDGDSIDNTEIVAEDNPKAAGCESVETVEDASIDARHGLKVEDGDLNVGKGEIVVEDRPDADGCKVTETAEYVTTVAVDDSAGLVSQDLQVEDGNLSVGKSEVVDEDKSEAAMCRNNVTVEDASMVDVDDGAGVVSQCLKVEDGDLNVGDGEIVLEDNCVDAGCKVIETAEDVARVAVDDSAGLVSQGPKVEAENLSAGNSEVVAEDKPEAAICRNNGTVEDAFMVDVVVRDGVVGEFLKVEDGDLNDDTNLDGPVAVTVTNPVSAENSESMVECNSEAVGRKNKQIVEDTLMADADDKFTVVNQFVEDHDLNDDRSLDGPVAAKTDIAVSLIETESDNQRVSSSCQNSSASEKLEDSNPLIEDSMLNPDLKSTEINNQRAIMQSNTSDQCSGLGGNHEDPNPPAEDATFSPYPSNQVSEVKQDLGFPVKCESISTNYVSINEKNDLKDNLTPNNFHLEVDVLKPEMVQPSSGSVPSVVNVHTFDAEKEPGKDQVSLKEIDAKRATALELGKKEDNGDGDSSGKLKLDKSSGDESIEEDARECKYTVSSSKSIDLEEKSDVNLMHDVVGVVVGTLVDDMAGRLSPGNKNIAAKEKVSPTASEKRKVEDQEVETNDSSKRQRRWNPETTGSRQLQSSTISSSSGFPKDALQPIAKHRFARSDSMLSLDSPKERYVPPSQKPATSSLRIDRFQRPFTIKAVQDLLAKTGTVCNFWIDQIKTHCYVTYSSAEEAAATRNSVYNLQWPPNGGRLLVAEFVDPQEVKRRTEAPQSPVPISPSPMTAKAPLVQQLLAPKLTRQHSFRQQLPPPPPLSAPPLLSDLPIVREQLPPPPLAAPPSVRERLPPPPPLTAPSSARERLPPPLLAAPLRERLPPPPLAALPSARERLQPSALTTPPSAREWLPSPSMPAPSSVRERLPSPPPAPNSRRKRLASPPLPAPPSARRRLPSPPLPSPPSFRNRQPSPPLPAPSGVRERLPPPPPLFNQTSVRERLPPPPLSIQTSLRERLPLSPPPLSKPPSVSERLPPPPLFSPPSGREQLPPPPLFNAQPVRERLPPPPPANPANVRERLPPPPPPLQRKQEPVVLTLDDLFQKTRSTPRIYYLPLSEEQVAAKLAAKERN